MEFGSKGDMEYALDKLDGAELSGRRWGWMDLFTGDLSILEIILTVTAQYTQMVMVMDQFSWSTCFSLELAERASSLLSRFFYHVARQDQTGRGGQGGRTGQVPLQV